MRSGSSRYSRNLGFMGTKPDSTPQGAALAIAAERMSAPFYPWTGVKMEAGKGIAVRGNVATGILLGSMVGVAIFSLSAAAEKEVTWSFWRAMKAGLAGSAVGAALAQTGQWMA